MKSKEKEDGMGEKQGKRTKKVVKKENGRRVYTWREMS